MAEDQGQGLVLVIGNHNYSSWSLRPWFFLKYFNVPFECVRIALDQQDTATKLAAYSPTRKVPVLRDGALIVWESSAICEFVNDKFNLHGLPEDLAARAVARSVSAEMHSGFGNLRKELPMNCRKTFENFMIPPAAQKDVDRVQAIWTQCRETYGSSGPWLFGKFSIADAMYAPVVFRFASYKVAATKIVEDYMKTVLDHPAIREWEELAKAELEVIPQEER